MSSLFPHINTTVKCCTVAGLQHWSKHITNILFSLYHTSTCLETYSKIQFYIILLSLGNCYRVEKQPFTMFNVHLFNKLICSISKWRLIFSPFFFRLVTCCWQSDWSQKDSQTDGYGEWNSGNGCQRCSRWDVLLKHFK